MPDDATPSASPLREIESIIAAAQADEHLRRCFPQLTTPQTIVLSAVSA
jgi:hypothetical protein